MVTGDFAASSAVSILMWNHEAPAKASLSKLQPCWGSWVLAACDHPWDTLSAMQPSRGTDNDNWGNERSDAPKPGITNADPWREQWLKFSFFAQDSEHPQ